MHKLFVRLRKTGVEMALFVHLRVLCFIDSWLIYIVLKTFRAYYNDVQTQLVRAAI